MTTIDWEKILTGFGLALAGAALAFAAEQVIPALEQSGSAALLAVAAVASTLINVARKWLASR